MTAPAQLQDGDRAQWVCDANYITCQHSHLLRFVDAKFNVDQRRLDGHIFFACKKCEPTTYFFGVVTSRPSPSVSCYAITQEQFRFWNDSDADPLPTPQMLHLLGYNPRWRQQRKP
jgi:hypothetical protein